MGKELGVDSPTTYPSASSCSRSWRKTGSWWTKMTSPRRPSAAAAARRRTAARTPGPGGARPTPSPWRRRTSPSRWRSRACSPCARRRAPPCCPCSPRTSSPPSARCSARAPAATARASWRSPRTGYGFLRTENYLPGAHDVYVAINQIRKFDLKTGDKITGKTRPQKDNEKNRALLYITAINDQPPEEALHRREFDELTPIFPNQRYTMECEGASQDLALRIIDLIAPVGKGQRA